MRCYDRRPLDATSHSAGVGATCSLRRPTANRSVRLVKVSRHGDRHDLNDLTVAIRFEGDYDESYTDGDNTRRAADRHDEEHGVRAGRRQAGRRAGGVRPSARAALSRSQSAAARASASTVTEQPWGRIALGPRQHGQAFVRSGAETRTATRRRATRDRITVGAGVSDLVILKSSHSAFAGFLRDEYTTLPDDARSAARDVADRHVAAIATTDVDFNLTWRAVRTTLLETFAEHDSQSVQHTLHAMGQAVLDSVDVVDRRAAGDAEQAPPPGRPVAPRPREPQRDLRADR